MKNIRLITYVILIFSLLFYASEKIYSQPPAITTITLLSRQYCYDEAGNRTCRYPITHFLENVGKTSFGNDYCLRASDINIYPVPNSGNFTIEQLNGVKDLKTEIYSIDGKKILTSNFHSRQMEFSELNFTAGIYILSIFCGNMQLDWKIVVE